MAINISPVNMEDRRSIGVQPGDTVRVWQKIQEKGKTRLQVFEGLVLARKHGNEPGATFTVRRATGNVGVEKVFPLYSPMIDRIEIVKRSKVRRAKLYYIREKAAREIRRQMRHMKMMNLSTVSDIAEKEREVKVAQKDSEKEKSSTQSGDAETGKDSLSTIFDGTETEEGEELVQKEKKKQNEVKEKEVVAEPNPEKVNDIEAKGDEETSKKV